MKTQTTISTMFLALRSNAAAVRALAGSLRLASVLRPMSASCSVSKSVESNESIGSGKLDTLSNISAGNGQTKHDRQYGNGKSQYPQFSRFTVFGWATPAVAVQIGSGG